MTNYQQRMNSAFEKALRCEQEHRRRLRDGDIPAANAIADEAESFLNEAIYYESLIRG